MSLRAIVLACLFFSSSIATADPVFTWVEGIGDFDVESLSIAVDPTGNTYTAGLYVGTNDMDPGAGTTTLTVAGIADGFVVKLDANGDFVWARSFGGTDIDVVSSVAVDEDQNVYIMGEFEDTADLDPGVGVANFVATDGSDLFVAKLDSNGDFVWARTYTANVDELLTSPRAIQADGSGNVLITGVCENDTDFDPSGAVATTSGGAFVLKLDADGDLVWVKAIPSASGRSVAMDASGNVTAVGTFQSTTDLDPGPGSAPATPEAVDVFIVRLTSNGNYIWSAVVGGDDEDSVGTVYVDSGGSPYLAGYFSDGVDLDPGPDEVLATEAGLYVLKLSPSGLYQWGIALGPLASQDAPGIGVGINGDVFVAANFSGTVDFDSGPGTEILTSNVGAAYLLKLNALGDFQWVGSLTGPFMMASAVGAGDVIHMTGNHPGATIDYDMSGGTNTLPPLGGLSAFVLTMDDDAPTLPIRREWISVLAVVIALIATARVRRTRES